MEFSYKNYIPMNILTIRSGYTGYKIAQFATNSFEHLIFIFVHYLHLKFLNWFCIELCSDFIQIYLK